MGEYMSQTVNFLRTFNRWRRGDETLEQPSPRVVGEMIDAACDQIERLTIQRDESWAAFGVATDQCSLAQSNLREAMKIADAMHSAMCAGAFDDGASVLFRKLQQRLKETSK
jgi:hypothetical protein